MSTPLRALTHAAGSWRRAVLADPGCARVTDLRVEVDGQVVLAHGGGAPHDLFSVTKTVLALLVGVAIEQQVLPPLDTPAVEAPGMAAYAGLDGVTLGQLLSLRRGAATDGPHDLDVVAVGSEPAAEVFARAPREEPPGTAFRYDNGASHLLAEALQRAAPGGLARFAEEHLFTPLGLAPVTWASDAAGTPWGPAHLSLSAAGLARIGRLLTGGTYAGTQVVGADWVRAMRTPTSAGGPPEERPYGLGVWCEDDRTWFGAGWGGQLLLVRPDEGLVVVAQSDPGFNYGPPAGDALPRPWTAPLDHARHTLLSPS